MLQAVNTTAVRHGQTARAPVTAKQRSIPHQAVPGKRMPAAVNGDAHPMIPSGGNTLSAMATRERQIASVRRGDQTTSHGNDNSTELEIQRPIATRADTSGPKKFLAPGTSGQRAAA